MWIDKRWLKTFKTDSRPLRSGPPAFENVTGFYLFYLR